MCWEIIDVYNDYFGKSKYRRKVARVKCDCGTIEVRRFDHVKSGRTKHCKRCSAKTTIKDNPNHGWLTHNNQTIGLLSKTFFSTYRNGAKRRGIEFNISQQYAWNLFEKQENKCALTGMDITLSPDICESNPAYAKFTASLDRKDNNKGYVEGNVQWVHKEINRFKNDYSMSEFIEMCKAVHLYHQTNISLNRI